MNIGKDNVAKAFLDKVLESKKEKEDSFYSSLKDYFFEEKLNLGGYGYVDILFYKKRTVPTISDTEEVLEIRTLTICSNMAGFDEILKSSKIKQGVLKYIRDVVGVGYDKKIYYGNYLICPGFKDHCFEIMSNDIPSLMVYQYEFDSSGFNLYNVSDRLIQLNPSQRVLKIIKKRLL